MSLTVGFAPKAMMRLMVLLSPKGLYDDDIGESLEMIGMVVSGDQVRNAPVLYNRLKPSLNKGGAGNIWQTSGSGANMSLVMGTNVSHKGKSYPKMLDTNPRYHYARGPMKGQRTLGFFSGAFRRTWDHRQQVMRWFMGKIAARWGKR